MKNDARLYRLKDTESNRYLDFTYPCEVIDKTQSSVLEWDEIVEKYCTWRRFYNGEVYIIVDAKTDEKVEPDSSLVSEITTRLFPPQPPPPTLVFYGLIDQQEAS